MNIYKPTDGETVFLNDKKYIVDFIRGDYANIISEDGKGDYVLFWLLENIRQNRKKKLERVKDED